MTTHLILKRALSSQRPDEEHVRTSWIVWYQDVSRRCLERSWLWDGVCGMILHATTPLLWLHRDTGGDELNIKPTREEEPTGESWGGGVESKVGETSEGI